MSIRSRFFSFLVLPFLCAAFLDEGMWTFMDPPRKQLKERYDFEPTQKWLDHVRLSSVRFNNGGSGSFVSPHGLVMTNHHVGMDAIHKLSTPEKDYVKNGFYARTLDQELDCPDLELNVLESMYNVTGLLRGIEDDAEKKSKIASIEKEETERTGLRCDVVSLYQGGEYWVYRYKKYKHVKLVMAPEQETAFFGGDPDNFTYPRFNLDMAFFRIYGEDGKPVATPHHFRWSENGPQEEDLVFVSGNPGSTGRLATLAEMEYSRTSQYPRILDILSRRLAAFREYAARGDEEARRANDTIFGLENSLKAYSGYLDGLNQPSKMEKKAREEAAFRAAVEKDSEIKQAVAGAWETIEKTRAELKSKVHGLNAARFQGRLLGLAGTIVQWVKEIEKPNGERLPRFRDSALDSLKFQVFSPAPIYPDMEEVQLAQSLGYYLEKTGPEDEFYQAALQGKTVAEVAKMACQNTKLLDVDYRKELIEGGLKAVEQSEDPMIALARRIEPIVRKRQKWFQEDIQAVEARAKERIAAARFRIYGKTVYPDANFTLRLSYGAVRGYEVEGTLIPWKTTYHGLFARHASFDGKKPFQLPKQIVERASKVQLHTPLNFVCTTDIIGGNSGSPVINREAEVVGLIFDGNIQSVPNRFVYEDTVARAVAVHSSGIIEALRSLYDADKLANEILNGNSN